MLGLAYANHFHNDFHFDEQYFNRALVYTPQYAYLHVNLGVLKGAQKDAAAAEQPFRDAQRYDPGNPVSYYSSRRALALRPDYAEAYNNICAAENSLRRFAEGVAACERALAIKPDYPLARNNLAYARSNLPK